jgi:hypothetical protein
MAIGFYVALHFVAFFVVGFFGGRAVNMIDWRWTVPQIIYMVLLILIIVSLGFPGLIINIR